MSELPTFVSTEVDYLACASTFTVCRLLHYMIQSGSTGAADAGATEHATDMVFQMNHTRILEMKAGEQCTTNRGDRLFPTARVMDCTGTAELKMREKAALALAGVGDREAFVGLASTGALNFPILCSLRIAIRKQAHKPGEAHSTDESAREGLDAIIVEASEQDLVSTRSLPNASMSFVSQLLLSLTPDLNKMIAAPIADVGNVPHAGMVVNTGTSTQLQAACVLSLVAHIGRSSVSNLPGGHKLISKDVWNVPFEAPTTTEDGAPEHADKKIQGDLASYCTMENVQDYTLTGRKPKEPVYALIVISSVHEGKGDNPRHTYMVDKVSIQQSENIPMICNLLMKLRAVAVDSECKGKANSKPDWRNEQTPCSAKKARRLSDNPTDEDYQTPGGNPQ